MFETNVEGTRTALDAAAAAGVSRIVYVSTVGVFGNTHGQVVDETYERPDRDFLSYYDATKFLAHTIAAERAAAGAPIVTVQPGAIYGPGDHSELGQQIEQARRGRYRVRMFPALGATMSYLDDVADGVVLAADKGVPGEAYVLGGEITRLGTVLDVVADLSGRRRARGDAAAGGDQGRRAARGRPRAAARRGTGPARDDPRQRRGDVLGVERQGETRARLRPSRPQPGPARPAQHGSSRLTYTRATAFASPAPRVRSCPR